jgi:MFS transporter, ACS family, tartrate transporter
MPSIVVLVGQLLIGWSSDRNQERRWHASLPILLGVLGFALAPWTHGHFALTLACFMMAAGGMKSYMPAFWTLPKLFLTSTAAAGSIGLYFLSFLGLTSAVIILSMKIAKKQNLDLSENPSTKL